MNTETPTLNVVTDKFTQCSDCALMPKELAADQVAEVVAYVDTEQDEEDIWGLLRLKDGRWAVWHIWADYTGHG